MERPGVVCHAVEHEGVQSIRCPRVVDLERFEDDERSMERVRVLNGAVEGEVPRRPPRRDHPIENERSLGMNGRIIGGADPVGHHSHYIEATPPCYDSSLRNAVKHSAMASIA